MFIHTSIFGKKEVYFTPQFLLSNRARSIETETRISSFPKENILEMPVSLLGDVPARSMVGDTVTPTRSGIRRNMVTQLSKRRFWFATSNRDVSQSPLFAWVDDLSGHSARHWCLM